MKGIILAGGSGTRLYPLTKIISKQLLPVYDKPMIYYPLSLLMLADIKEVLIISTPEDTPNFAKLLGDGTQLGIRLEYAVQPKPEGLPQAFIIGEKFLAGAAAIFILGDNIFYGSNLPTTLRNRVMHSDRCVIFGTKVADPERYGVVELDAEKRPVALVEKPVKPNSPFAVTGLYIFPTGVSEEAKKLKPSGRNELEILDLVSRYHARDRLDLELLGRGTAWFDTGTHQSLLDAENFIATIQHRQGLQVACLEEIAFEKGWISREMLFQQAEIHGKSSYGEYLLTIARERNR